VNIKIVGKWMFIPLKMVLIGIDPYPSGLYKIALQLHNNIQDHPSGRQPLAARKHALKANPPDFKSTKRSLFSTACRSQHQMG